MSRPYGILRPFSAVLPCFHAKFARFVTDIVPAETVFVRAAFFAPLGDSVDEKFGLVAARIDMYRRNLTFAPRPCPMRQNVRRRHVPSPMGLIKPIAVLRNPREIENPEIGTAPARVAAGIGFSEIVEPGPYELAVDLRIALLMLKLDVRRIIVRMRAPKIVSAHLGADYHIGTALVAAAHEILFALYGRGDNGKEILPSA